MYAGRQQLRRRQSVSMTCVPLCRPVQDELVQLLRSDGRRQAAARMLKQKREGAAAFRGSDNSDED